MTKTKPKVLMDREKAFDEHIAPLLEELVKKCQKHKIPFLAAFQLQATDDNRAMMSISSGFPEHTASTLGTSEKILRGKMAVLGVNHTDAKRLGIADGAMKLLKEHAKSCRDCQMKIAASRVRGTTLTLEDFEDHDETPPVEEKVELPSALKKLIGETGGIPAPATATAATS